MKIMKIKEKWNSPVQEPVQEHVRRPVHRFSGFTHGTCELHAALQARGIDTLIISGTLTNCCCESTARDAMQMNYKVIVAAHACAALSDEAHAGTLDSMALIFADLRSVEELEGLLMGEVVEA